MAGDGGEFAGNQDEIGCSGQAFKDWGGGWRIEIEDEAALVEVIAPEEKALFGVRFGGCVRTDAGERASLRAAQA